MHARVPLSTLLSWALVAFTIEFDNEAEHRMPHRTTRHGRTPGCLHAPWLASLAMWSSCMQFVGKEGITLGELEKRARTKTHLNGMVRWGYIRVEMHVAGSQRNSPRQQWVVRATAAGQKADEIWRDLFEVIESRWRVSQQLTVPAVA